MKSVISFLQDCCLGKKKVYLNLAVFPELFPDFLGPYYLTLVRWRTRRMIRLEVSAG